MKRKNYEIAEEIFERNNNGKPIILYGAGALGIDVFGVLKSSGVIPQYFCDRKLFGTEICGVSVVSPEDLPDVAGEGSVIVITCGDYDGVIETLLNLGGDYDVIGYQILQRLRNNAKDGKYLPGKTSVQKALKWFRENTARSGGIMIHDSSEDAYPECTGYTIPTLIDCGYRKFAVKLGKWLESVQTSTGGIIGAASDRVFLFDTAQVLRGYLALCKTGEDFHESAKKAAACLYKGLLENGVRGFEPQYDSYGSGAIPESIMLYALPPLVEAGEMFDIPEYLVAVNNCVEFYKNASDFLKTSTLTHFLAYQLEALIDLGFFDLALPTLDFLQGKQTEEGSVPANDGVNWVCIPGLAQLAICWYKLGRYEPADKAMKWLAEAQNRSGGHYGSLGLGATYFSENEICWATKFYVDAYRLRIKSNFDREAVNFPADIAATDGRVLAISGYLKKFKENNTVVEVGCGRGRFLKALLSACPSNKYIGVDISSGMLSLLPGNIQGVEGSLECLPLPDETAEFVFSVEAVEHSVNLKAAVSELARICKIGGRVTIIDKQQKDWGRFKCPEWERWPEKDMLRTLISNFCDNVEVCPVVYDNSREGDELMLMLTGVKK
jgi:malonyl-CoA O-methyltransferase